jgi:DNA-binding NarL/FixJ family response regulator
MRQVFLIEDQAILREFIQRLISGYDDISCIGAHHDGLAGLEQVRQLKPDMVILDVMLPGISGVDILRHIKRELPRTRVLGFSAFPNQLQLRHMVEHGADGLVRKTEGLEILERAIREVCAGHTFFSPSVVDMLRQLMLNPRQASSVDDLSAREREVLQLIAQSHSNKEVAGKLGISVKTAETHRNNIMRKLDIHDAVGLTRFAISNGLVTSNLYE